MPHDCAKAVPKLCALPVQSERKASAYPIKAIFDTKNWKFSEKFKILDTVYLERGKNTDLYTQNKKILKNRERFLGKFQYLFTREIK